MVRNPNDLAPLYDVPHPGFAWEPLQAQPNARLWTDDYSNLLGCGEIVAENRTASLLTGCTEGLPALGDFATH